MNEHNIDNFMKLATNGKDASDRGSDHYYQGVYEKIMSGKKVCWNWAAALFGASWLLYRKMFAIYFLYYIVVVLCAISGSIIAFSLIAEPLSLQDPSTTFIISAFAMGIISGFLVLGFFGNWLYLKHIHKKIDKGHHLYSLQNTSSFLAWMSVVSPLLLMFCIPFIVLKDKAKRDNSIG